MTDTGPPPPDTSEMLAVHKVFRQALDGAGGLVGGVADGDADRARLIAGYYDEILTLLTLHHDGEDVLVWPKLLERAPAQAELVRTAQSQHQDIHESLGRARAALKAWEAAPDAQQRASLVGALGELEPGLVAHLDNEEQTVLPLIGEHLTIEEWGELPAHAMGSYTGDRIWLILGLVRENMNDAQRDMMLAHMPPPAVEMWATNGETAFNSYMGEVRSG